MVWFTSCNGGKIVGFWGENTSGNFWKKFGIFLGMAVTEDHAWIPLCHYNTYPVFRNIIVAFSQSMAA
jgi:hypothetical protein